MGCSLLSLTFLLRLAFITCVRLTQGIGNIQATHSVTLHGHYISVSTNALQNIELVKRDSLSLIFFFFFAQVALQLKTIVQKTKHEVLAVA